MNFNRLILISLFALGCSQQSAPETTTTRVQNTTRKRMPAQLSETVASIKKNSSVFQSLTKSGITPQAANSIVLAAKPHYNLARIAAGTKYSIYKNSQGQLKEVKFKLSTIKSLKLNLISKDKWQAQITKKALTKRMKLYSGEVTDSLWNSGLKANLPIYLLSELTDIFSWEIDFNRQVRPGDQWEIFAERLYSEGEPVGWGDVLYAKYIRSDNLHDAYNFTSQNGKTKGHYNSQGASLKRNFLRSPLKFGRVTSGFSLRRFHPIKKVYRPHRGVDYGAPTGTPIYSIGSGRITKRGRYGSAGKMMTIKHNGRFKTRYMHMSRFARGLRVGSSVRQGQVIGYVGRTGSATGPHLHFEMYKSGRFIDPLRVKFPATKKLSAKLYQAEFSQLKTNIDQLIETARVGDIKTRIVYQVPFIEPKENIQVSYFETLFPFMSIF